MPEDRADIIALVCDALSDDDRRAASDIARVRYPFISLVKQARAYTPRQSMRVFLRDGFRDRYSGQRLIFPATLRLLSKLLLDEFPAHPNWKMAESHLVFWELFPTIDHLVPVARGGADVEENWVTTSMLRNSAKAHWTVEELGWKLVADDCNSEWDGLTRWCLQYAEMHPDVLLDRYVRRWCNAARLALSAA